MRDMVSRNGLYAMVRTLRGNAQHSAKFKKQSGQTGFVLDEMMACIQNVEIYSGCDK